MFLLIGRQSKLQRLHDPRRNFLLNIGPTADGEIPPESVDRLAAIGRWMKVNGDSIHGTQGSPFPKLAWGRCTQRDLKNGKTRLYLHIFDWPAGGELRVAGLGGSVRRARLLAGPGAELPVSRAGEGLVVRGPASAPDPVDTVVVLEG